MRPALATRCIVFNKPYGVPSQFSDPAGEFGKTLKDYITVAGVYPVGRLDRDSEGLMLLTNDGVLQHRLTDPRYEHPKTYLVQVEGEPKESDLEPLRNGIEILGHQTRPAGARVLSAEPQLWRREPPVRSRKSIPTTWIELVLHEGRNRQVRRMTAAIGFPTLRLVRWAIGPVKLGGLAPGEWCDLRPSEIALLRRTVRSAGHPGR